MAIDANINRIKFLRTTTAGRIPTASLLDEGELAINLADGTIYSKNGANVVELGFGKGGNVSGAITAPQFNGPLVGNASTATKLQTARTISLTGSATGSISFDGSSNQSISVNVNAVDSLATYTKSNSDSPTKWAQGVQSVFVSSSQGWPLPYGGVITARPYGNGGGTLQILTAYGSDSGVGGGEIKIRTGDYSVSGNDGWTSWKTLVHSENVNDYSPTKTGSGASGTWGISISGNAASATKLATTRTIGGVSFDGTANINLPGVNTTGNQNTTGSAASLTTARYFSWTGDATGSLSFNGSANVSAVLTLANSGVSAGTYKSVTVDIKGRVTAGTNVITGLVTSTSASGTTNTATTNTNTYLNIVETIGSSATTVGTSTQVIGAGTVTVTSDTAGKLTITGSQNITGNAATATKLAVRNSINGTPFDGSSDITIAEPTFSGYLQYYPISDYNNISTNGFNVKYGIQSATNRPPGTDHAVITMSYSSIWTAQQAFDWRTNAVYTRCNTNGTWGGWKQLASTSDNVSSATKLQTARSIGIAGSGASGSISFDGTGNVNIPLTVATQATSTNNTTIATTAFVQAVNSADTGSSATALKLKSPVAINSSSFDGSTNIIIPNLKSLDNRTIKPNGIYNSYMTLYFVSQNGLTTSTTGGAYGDFLALSTYADSSGGKVNGLFFDKDIQRILHYQPTFNATSWGSPKTLAYAEDVLSLSGGTMSGALGVGTIQSASSLSILNGGNAQKIMTGGVLASSSYADVGNVPVGGIWARGNITTLGHITASGNVTAYSDKKLKENILPISDALNKVNSLNGVTYTRNDLEDKTLRHVGLIAQDVLKSIPEAVRKDKDTLMVDYMGLIGVLVESIKELKTEIDELKEKVK